MKKDIGKKIGAGIAMALCFLVVVGFGFMFLWNWLVPELFSGPVITYWQALGLLLLSKLIFGFGSKHKHEGGWAWKRKWKNDMRSKMEHLSPEEREKVKSHFDRCMSGRWGWKAPREEAPGTTEE